jgi:hydroxymethylbilane synthase
VQVRLEEQFPQRQFVLKTIKAEADERPDVPLVAMSGEGIFVKELEAALLDGRIDLAVHSLKDLPLAMPAWISLAAVTEREDARDAFISRSGKDFASLPAGSKVGTSSLRRRSQLLFARRDLDMQDIRGNVDTRLRKLEEGRYDAIVVAACGLIRLGLDERITEYLPFARMLPEPGQGSLGIQARSDDAEVLEIVKGLNDPSSRACVEAERAFLGSLGGGCRVPIAAFAQLSVSTLTLQGAVMSPDGTKRLHGQVSCPANALRAPDRLGRQLGDQLRAQGAEDVLMLK